jgi:hypothetical protein
MNPIVPLIVAVGSSKSPPAVTGGGISSYPVTLFMPGVPPPPELEPKRHPGPIDHPGPTEVLNATMLYSFCILIKIGLREPYFILC